MSAPAMITGFPRWMTLALVVALVGIVGGCQGDGEGSSAEQMAKGHEGDTPSATEAARAPDVAVDAQEVVYARTKDGSDIRGYLATPSRPDSLLTDVKGTPEMANLPGLVVIHEWWGLNDNVRAATRRLAGEGYRALAVDLYADTTAASPKEARALMQRAMKTPDALLANLRDAHEYLQSEWNAPRVAVLGWCFGGGWTFRAVADRPSAFSGAVAYYGSPESMTDSVLSAMTTPILAHFGTQDEVIAMDQVTDFRSRVDRSGADVQIYTYDAGHAFANPSGENYEPEAADKAWQRTTTFLRRVLYRDGQDG